MQGKKGHEVQQKALCHKLSVLIVRRQPARKFKQSNDIRVGVTPAGVAEIVALNTTSKARASRPPLFNSEILMRGKPKFHISTCLTTVPQIKTRAFLTKLLCTSKIPARRNLQIGFPKPCNRRHQYERSCTPTEFPSRFETGETRKGA